MPLPSSSRTQDDSESAVCPIYVRKCGLGPLQNPASQHFTPPDRDNADSLNISLSINHLACNLWENLPEIEA